MKSGLGNPKADLQLAGLLGRLGVMVLGHPPLMKVAPGVVAIVGIGGVQRRGQHRRCGVRRPAGPRKGIEIVIHNKPIGESELFIIINKKCQSHLMRRRRWFIDIFSSGISSATCLPRLSSPAMKNDWVYEREKEKLLQGFQWVEKSKGTVMDGDVFEAEVIGWYLKT